MTPLQCIVCLKEPEAVFEGSDQPYGATMFRSGGHYGSTVWDPGPNDNLRKLAINVCDECLKTRSDVVGVEITNPAPVRLAMRRWEPGE
jgi:hypothetical protein